jgi:AcrR family transcriptional regulator
VPDTGLGLRERKKQATRDALIETALELFAADGVDATSVEQIADRVDVSARTFHRYFASKDDALFADSNERLARAAELLAARPAEEPVLDSLRVVVVDLLTSITVDPVQATLRMQIIEASDRLRARSLRGSEELADRVADHVAARLGLDPTDALPRLLGTWTIGALRTAHRRWLADPALDLAAEVDHAFALLADVGGATRRRP